MALPSGNSFMWLPATFGNAGLDVLKLENIEFKDVIFSDGVEGEGMESYTGGWRDGQPEGEGRYTWKDGSTYEGSWSRGQKHGWGRYQWPGGAWYLGEWRDGALHGYGTFSAPDGSKYQGSWENGLKHGIGTKWHANRDRYEGLWRGGQPSGPGRYVWACGNEYDGDFRDGKMHGQGTFKWATGHRYDGEWSGGAEDGIGVFTWPDGSTYEGFWVDGVKNGVGVFRPAQRAAHAAALAHLAAPPAAAAEVIRRSLATASAAAEAVILGTPVTTTPARRTETAPEAPLPTTVEADAAAAAAAGVLPSPASAGGGPRPTDAAVVDLTGEAPAAYVCEYSKGDLILEEPMLPEDLAAAFGEAFAREALGGVSGVSGGSSGRRLSRGKGSRKQRRRREDRLGETIFKGSRSYDLMLNLQLGIRYTLATLSKLPPPTALNPAHFDEKVWLRFPRGGSEVTPPHPSTDFKWKDYASTVFRRLRNLFGISNSEYILSTCGDHALRELPSPGKSGSVFFVSQDERFIIKTMRKEEVHALLRALPAYYAHVAGHPDTLLTRFYGVHRIQPAGGRKVRFVVMNNIFATDLPLHVKYDLKGSTYKRTVGPSPRPGAVLKDLDLRQRFRLPSVTAARLQAQLASDAGFLEAMGVMDYSLLLGVHFRGREWGGGGGAGSGAVGGDSLALGASEDMGGPWISTIDEIGDLGSEASASLGHEGSSAAASPTAAAGPSAAFSRRFLSTTSSTAVYSSANSDTEEPEASSLGRQPAAAASDEEASGTGLAAPAPPRRDMDHELTTRTHSMTTDPNLVAVPRGRGRVPTFGFRRFFNWRRDKKEKRRQRAEQAAGSAHLSPVQVVSGPQQQQPAAAVEVGAAAAAEKPVTAEPLPELTRKRSSRSSHRRTSSAMAWLGSSQPSSPTAARGEAAAFDLPAPPPLPSRTASGRRKMAPKLTYSERLAEQHAALVASLASRGAAEARGSSAAAEADALSALGRAMAAATAATTADGAQTWRADAAALPEDAAGAGDEPPTPSTARAFNILSSAAHRRSATLPEYKDRAVSAPSTALASVAEGNGGGVLPSPFMRIREEANAEAAATADSSPKAAAAAIPSATGAGAASRDGDAPSHHEQLKAALEELQAAGRAGEEANTGTLPTRALSAAEAEEMVASVAGRLSKPLGDRLARDLVRLARYKILGPEAASGARVPTAVLATRHLRSASSRTSVDFSLKGAGTTTAGTEAGIGAPGVDTAAVAAMDAAALSQSLSRHVPATAVPLRDGAAGGLSASAMDASVAGISGSGSPDGGEEVALFLGVIDWLQPWNARKRFEHGFKALVLDGKAISVCDPRAYAKRFMKMMRRVLVPAPEGAEGADGAAAAREGVTAQGGEWEALNGI